MFKLFPRNDITRSEIALHAAVSAYYSLPGNACGGLCHIVLDDGNVDDDSIDFCIVKCHEQHDWLGAAIMSALKDIPLEHREKALSPYEEREV